MDDISASPPDDPTGPDVAFAALSAPSDFLKADDPLGDEAAFPSTWQCLGPAEGLDD